jgi:type VI secretion system protein ImpL
MNRQFYMQQMRFVLGIGGFMSFYGIAGLAIWASGKYLGVRPSMQIVIFVMLLLTLPIVLVGGFFVSRKNKKKKLKAAEEEKKQGKDGKESKSEEDAPSAPSGNHKEIPVGAKEVISFLKSSDLGAAGKEAVYSLPWYLVIGGKKSGKTSLVLGSDLDFQALPSQRRSDLKLVRPTKQVDWRVTADAVFIDTAGRFQGDTSQDEWASLVDTIKKQRPKRPLDGLLLAVNTEELMNSDERAVEEQAKMIRSRLDDATKRLKTRFPVYLIFTHADAIEGFRDSFSRSKKDGDNLVWGSTIPLEKSANAQALFDSEYELLQDSVMKRRLIRLSAPFSPVRQLRIFNFPLHVGSARRKLGAFVTTLFRPNPFSESPFLRGFYFTAAPPDTKRGRGKPGMIPRTLSETFFTKKLFRDVILRDKDLVRTFYEQKQKPPIMGWLLTAFLTLVVISMLGLAGLSLYNNKRLMEDTSRAGDEVLALNRLDEGKDVLKKSPEEAQQEIEKLETLRQELVRLDNFEREGPPIWYRFGFYSGSRIYRERLLNIYYIAVEGRFRQPTLAKMEKDLLAFSRSPSISAGSLNSDQEKILDKHYDLLKAYLMLTTEYKDRAESSTIIEALGDTWVSESKLPAGNEVKAKAQLDFYFKQVDRSPEYASDSSGFPRFSENKTMVKAVRTKLEAFPPYLRYLKLNVAEVTKELGTVTVDTLLQGRSQGVMTGTHPVPGAFTIDGYRKFMKQSFVDAATKMNKDDWVMGRKDENAQASPDDLAKLQDKYFNDYTDHWRKLIRDVKISAYNNQEDVSKSLGAFSDTDSPMKLLLSEIAANTDFSTKAEAKGWTDLSWIDDWWSGKGATDGEETKNIVEREFRPLFAFIGDEKDDKGSGVSKYGAMVKDLNDDLGNISASEKADITDELINEKGRRYSLLKKVENGVTDLTRGFDSQAGKEIATLLKEPVSGVRAYFGAGAKSQLEKDWAQKVLSKARQIESGYPFTSDGEADLTNVTGLLNPVNGELSKFYKERLERYFEEVNGVLKVKESSDIKFTAQFVSYLNSAFKLRKTLFGDNATANFEYEFRLMPVTDALIEVTIDGQTVASNQTGSSKLKFPASTGTSTGVLMRFSSTASGPTLPSTQPSVNPAAPTTNYLQDSDTAEIKHQGTWGLFRFFDAGGPQKQPGGDYLLSYKLGGKTVQATVKPSGGDLFDKSIFQTVKAPEKMIQ